VSAAVFELRGTVVASALFGQPVFLALFALRNTEQLLQDAQLSG
jgi:hypothetical protein